MIGSIKRRSKNGRLSVDIVLVHHDDFFAGAFAVNQKLNFKSPGEELLKTGQDIGYGIKSLPDWSLPLMSLWGRTESFFGATYFRHSRVGGNPVVLWGVDPRIREDDDLWLLILRDFQSPSNLCTFNA